MLEDGSALGLVKFFRVSARQAVVQRVLDRQAHPRPAANSLPPSDN
jgi:hypothetical protein